MKRFCNIILIAVFSASLSPLAGATPQTAFKAGEQLEYVISYRAKLVPSTDVATVVLSVEQGTYGQKDALIITGAGKVMSFFKWFFDLNDTYRSWVDPLTLKPMYATCDIREGGYSFSSRFEFDWAKKQVNTSYRNLKRPADSHKTMPLTAGSYDGLAMFYNLRSMPESEWVKGRPQQLKMVIEDTIRTINYKYLGRERKKLKGIGEFKTLKFSCLLVTSSGESFEDGTELFLWVTDDKNRIPLYIESPIKVGSVRARIYKFENLKYPLDSKIK